MLELVTIRVSAATPGAAVRLAQDRAEAMEQGRRSVVFDGAEQDVLVLRGELGSVSLNGPAIIELPESTVCIPPGWGMLRDATDTIDLRLGAQWQT
jgi:hypothetical protein